jgi:hypothetical protein
MKAIAYAHVLGPGAKPALTPSGLPILLSTIPFEDAEVSPATAIAERTAKRFGYVPHLPHWVVEAQYRVKPDASVKSSKGDRSRIPFERAYVMRFEHPGEVAKRRSLKIEDTSLDHIAVFKSWWAVPETV